MTNIGYARVSTKDQDLALQVDALRAAGCELSDIYTDHGVSGKLAKRPGLDQALEHLEPGDTLVVWKLDRLGRSVQHLVAVVNTLGQAGIGFRSLTEGIDTTTNGGRLVFHIFAAIAEFERGLIAERTQAGLDAARAKGHYGGRPPALTREQQALARRLHGEDQSVATIARLLGTSRQTVYRCLDVEPAERHA